MFLNLIPLRSFLILIKSHFSYHISLSEGIKMCVCACVSVHPRFRYPTKDIYHIIIGTDRDNETIVTRILVHYSKCICQKSFNKLMKADLNGCVQGRKMIDDRTLCLRVKFRDKWTSEAMRYGNSAEGILKAHVLHWCTHLHTWELPE
jgi:hypothetical protein